MTNNIEKVARAIYNDRHPNHPRDEIPEAYISAAKAAIAAMQPIEHYKCKICGGNPTSFPYEPAESNKENV